MPGLNLHATDAELVNFFTYHPADTNDGDRYDRIRAAGLLFARVICEETPGGVEQTVAIQRVREAVFNANAAIACRSR